MPCLLAANHPQREPKRKRKGTYVSRTGSELHPSKAFCCPICFPFIPPQHVQQHLTHSRYSVEAVCTKLMPAVLCLRQNGREARERKGRKESLQKTFLHFNQQRQNVALLWKWAGEASISSRNLLAHFDSSSLAALPTLPRQSSPSCSPDSPQDILLGSGAFISAGYSTVECNWILSPVLNAPSGPAR